MFSNKKQTISTVQFLTSVTVTLFVLSTVFAFSATNPKVAYANTSSATWDFDTSLQSWVTTSGTALFTTDGSPSVDSIASTVSGRSQSLGSSGQSPLITRASMSIPSNATINFLYVTFRTKTISYTVPGATNNWSIHINNTDVYDASITGTTSWSTDISTSNDTTDIATFNSTGVTVSIHTSLTTGASSTAIVRQLFDHITFFVDYSLPTPTPTITNTSTNTPIPPTDTPTPTATATSTNTPIPPTDTPTPTVTATSTNTPITATDTPTSTATATATNTPTPPTNTPTPTATPTSISVTATPTPDCKPANGCKCVQPKTPTATPSNDDSFFFADTTYALCRIIAG